MEKSSTFTCAPAPQRALGQTLGAGRACESPASTAGLGLASVREKQHDRESFVTRP